MAAGRETIVLSVKRNLITKGTGLLRSCSPSVKIAIILMLLYNSFVKAKQFIYGNSS